MLAPELLGGMRRLVIARKTSSSASAGSTSIQRTVPPPAVGGGIRPMQHQQQQHQQQQIPPGYHIRGGQQHPAASSSSGSNMGGSPPYSHMNPSSTPIFIIIPCIIMFYPHNTMYCRWWYGYGWSIATTHDYTSIIIDTYSSASLWQTTSRRTFRYENRGQRWWR